MLLKSFSVEGLYGTFNYTLDFSKGSNLMVLTGLNGYGKTTILRILSCISNKDDLFYLYEIPFNKIKISFDSGTRLVVKKINSKKVIGGDEETDELEDTRLLYYRGNKLIYEYEIDFEKYRSSGYYEKNRRNNSEREVDEFDSFRWLTYRRHDDDSIEKLMMNLSLLNTTFIRSQRLYNEDREGVSHRTINEVSEKMKEKLSVAYYNYLDNAQKLDGHQIDELLSDNTPLLSEEEYRVKAKEISELVSELLTYNLLPQLQIRPYNSSKALISSVYINTLGKKLEAYDDIRKKLKLYLHLLNNKEFVNKRFGFSRNEGLRVLLKTGGVLKDLTKLSSGEQNEIFLLYKFIFEAPDKSILLIDEPELSLHVAWQLQFIKDIKQIAKTREVQIIIATHSPEIVSESIDECVDLTEMANS